MLRRILCKIGIHWPHWEQSRPLEPADGFPPHFIKYERATRTCRQCGQTQYWLPGYGGSEWGCWMPLEQEGADA